MFLFLGYLFYKAMADQRRLQREHLQEALQESLPPRVRREEDMTPFRHASMTPASFAPQRHVYMCCGRPMVVRCLMFSLLGTPPTILDHPPVHHQTFL